MHDLWGLKCWTCESSGAGGSGGMGRRESYDWAWKSSRAEPEESWGAGPGKAARLSLGEIEGGELAKPRGRVLERLPDERLVVYHRV